MNPTVDELRGYLQRIDAGKGPVDTLDGHASCRFTPAFCPPARAMELMKVASRPPPGFTILKFGSRSVVGSYAFPDGFKAVLKYYYPKHFHKHLTYGIQGSRCYQSWVAALAFQYVNLPTPLPLLINEWKLLGGFWLNKSFLATRHASGCTLHDWVLRHVDDTPRLQKMAGQLRAIFSSMAEYHISHGDLKANNLLVDADDGLCFVDLDAATILAPAAKWPSLRERDIRIFQANWRDRATAAAAFANVFGNIVSP